MLINLMIISCCKLEYVIFNRESCSDLLDATDRQVYIDTCLTEE